MKYLFVKLRRDMTKMWTQFFCVFMMALLSVMIYSGMEGVWHGLNEVTEKWQEHTPYLENPHICRNILYWMQYSLKF